MIAALDLRDAVARKHRVMRVTAVESYAQCPFQFFGRHTLKLEEPPKRPEDRLDARVQGNIVHQVVAEWQRAPQPIVPLFERVFAEICRQEDVAPGYRTESLRVRMRADLERFAGGPGQPAGPGTRIEEPFQFALAESLEIRGRIDRMDCRPTARPTSSTTSTARRRRNSPGMSTGCKVRYTCWPWRRCSRSSRGRCSTAACAATSSSRSRR